MFKLTATAFAAVCMLTSPRASAVLPERFGCAAPHMAVDQKSTVRINGIDQWVTVKGDDCANPIILFVHGGPGNPLSPYSDALYGAWTGKFTLVHWDQRGSGKTFEVSRPAEDAALTLEQLRDDGIAMAE